MSGVWGFAYDDADLGMRERWVARAEVFDRAITVPFPPELSGSGIADASPHPVRFMARASRMRRGAHGRMARRRPAASRSHGRARRLRL